MKNVVFVALIFIMHNCSGNQEDMIPKLEMSRETKSIFTCCNDLINPIPTNVSTAQLEQMHDKQESHAHACGELKELTEVFTSLACMAQFCIGPFATPLCLANCCSSLCCAQCEAMHNDRAHKLALHLRQKQ